MAKTEAPDQPAGITPSDALARCVSILDKVPEHDEASDNCELPEPRQRVVRALAAFYDVTLPAGEPVED